MDYDILATSFFLATAYKGWWPIELLSLAVWSSHQQCTIIIEESGRGAAGAETLKTISALNLDLVHWWSSILIRLGHTQSYNYALGIN